MTRTKSEDLALLVLDLAQTHPALMAEARELAIQVLGDYVVQDIVSQDEPHDAGCHVYQLGPCNC